MGYQLLVFDEAVTTKTAIRSVIKEFPGQCALEHVQRWATDLEFGYIGPLLEAPEGVYALDTNKLSEVLNLVVSRQGVLTIILDSTVVHKGETDPGKPRLADEVLEAFQAMKIVDVRRVAVYEGPEGRREYSVLLLNQAVNKHWQGKSEWPLLGIANLRTGEIVPWKE